MSSETSSGFEPSGFHRAIVRLFSTYAEGFDDFDLDKVLSCFAYPVTIWQLGKGTVFADAEELAENVEALFDVFEAEEIVQSRFAIGEAASDGNGAFVGLSWTQERLAGEIAMEFRCRYALRRDDFTADWRIALVINEEEVSIG
ncbi:hypothetical protein LQ948_16225 [Jiella sp. MQZ9-1]|uniref:SnoaL-like domain-containing protein n=1 Tax=Jiella flava TaxID=2816857 RepID=A0A939JTS9_9HYPH|nr:hypothetical protein [Jiella flava]MBO0664323.1 hypothetical protein [Jiella flava]MCD2472754.1 hypothetical protein [Jiella flava]